MDGGRLNQLARAIFAAAGCDALEAESIGDHLVAANLAGHDSHGVINIPTYVQWVREGTVRPNQKVRIVIDHGAFVLADGQLGFGQAIGEQVMRLGIERAEQHGVGIIALRNSGHLGRIGHWAEMAVQANKISLHFVNSNGLGMIVVPVGGISRHFSPMGPEKAALFGIKRLTRTTSKPNGGGPYENRV